MFLAADLVMKPAGFDTAERKWEEIASMQPKLMINASGVATRGKIFVCDTSVCTVYEVSRNEWQPIASTLPDFVWLVWCVLTKQFM